MVTPISAGAIPPDCFCILSFSSSMIRWASRFPTPGAEVSTLSSSDMMAAHTRSGVLEDKMAMATLGPTPDTEISISKHRRSPAVAKP